MITALYYLSTRSFTNDYSWYGCIYLIHEELESFYTFQIYEAEVENQLNKNLRVLDQIMVESSMEEMTNLVNNVLEVLPNIFSNQELSLSILFVALLIWMA